MFEKKKRGFCGKKLIYVHKGAVLFGKIFVFQSNIKSVCKKKGCWMNLDLTDGNKAFVKFKDYAFFVPLNADGSSTIVSGYAFIDVVSVDELKHYIFSLIDHIYYSLYFSYS